MHEVSICQSIVETLETELEEDQLKNVRQVHLKVGVLSCVEPKVLEHVFQYIIEGTALHDCNLYTELVEVSAACAGCKCEFIVDNYRFVCPECNAPSSTIIEGNELKIYKIILEEPSYAEVNQ
jgi:hydrogenase nickel incorporation protein HypA/HybF